MDNTKLTKEYLLNIVSRLLRYVILMNAPDSDTILSTEMEFNISNEPFFYIATISNIEKDNQGVTHKYEHILKISRQNNDCEYTMNDYVQVIDTYKEATTKTIGHTYNSNNEPVPITVEFKVGDEIVTKYAVYATDCVDYLHYLDDNHENRNVTIVHKATGIIYDYLKYEHTEYDEEGTVIHAQGDVMLDADKNLMYQYLPLEKQYHWNLVNTISDNISSSNTIEEPLD